MKHYIKQLLKDKTGCYSMREIVIGICMLLIAASWFAHLLFGVETPEYMFYAIVSLVAAGCFGYSIERNPASTKNPFKDKSK